MASLLDVSTPRREGPRFAIEIPDDWKQGRGVYGGLTIGALVRAVELHVDDASRSVRSVTAELPAPTLPGHAEIVVETLRSGNSLTAARAALVQGGETRAHVVATLAKARPGAGPTGWRDLQVPAAPPWKQLEPVAWSPEWPEFAQHFEMRIVKGVPMAGGDAEVIGWVRPRIPCAVLDAGYIASMVDVWWPAALPRFTTMRPIATISYMLEIADGIAGLDPDAPLLYRATVPVLADGYFVEFRELWGEDGRLVALNQQTIAVIA